MEAEFSEAITDPSEIFIICWFILWLKSYVEVNIEISSVDKWRVQMQKPLNAIWNFLL